MKSFRNFFKTTVGRKPQSEGGETKTAETINPVAASMKSAFGTPTQAPEPPPAPADVSTGETLGSKITAGLKSTFGL